MSGFDVNRSQVSDEALATFLKAEVEEDITTVPGVGPSAAGKLADNSEGEAGVKTTYQLIGKFLSLRDPDMASQTHCDAMFNWLKLKGVNAHRSGIVHAIAEKTDTMMPGIYNL